MDYSIDELREMLAEWAGWGETMADGRIGTDAAARFLADFERLIREDAAANPTIKHVGGPPHSRACGFYRHEHGFDCSKNCPTCHGFVDYSDPSRGAK